MTTPTKPPEFICPEGFQVCMSGNREYLAAELCGHLDDGEYFLIRRKPVEPDGRAMDSKPTKEGSIPSACDSCEYLTDEFLKEYSERCIYFNRRINQINQQIDELKARPSEATDNEWKLQVVNDINKLIGQRCELSDTVNRLQQQIDELELHKDRARNSLNLLDERLTALESKLRQVSEGNAVEKAIKATIAAFAAFDAGNMNLDELQDCIIGRIRKLDPAK